VLTLSLRVLGGLTTYLAEADKLGIGTQELTTMINDRKERR